MADKEENEEMADKEENKEVADNEESEKPATRGNEWEVVSLTGSTYAAAPTPEQVDVTDYEKSDMVEQNQPQPSLLLYRSGHFVFPPSQHENLPLVPETNEIRSVQESEDSGSQFLKEEGIQSKTKEQGEEGIQSDTKEQEMVINTKGLNISDEFPGIPIFDEKGNILRVGGTEFEERIAFRGLNMVDKERSFYDTGKFNSFHDDPTVGGSANVDEDTAPTEVLEPHGHGLDLSVSSVAEQVDKNSDGSHLPCEAWWKRRAAAFYTHAKEANTVWSIFVAAAVMGLVILGQQWQQERWQVMQLKWQFNINNEVCYYFNVSYFCV